jgi:hypothetical protein
MLLAFRFTKFQLVQDWNLSCTNNIIDEFGQPDECYIIGSVRPSIIDFLMNYNCKRLLN